VNAAAPLEFAYGFTQSACGGVRLRLAGDAVTFRASGALWVEGARALVVADLHLEKGSSYAIRGQMLPPYDTGDTLDRLEAEVTALEPDLLVLLGDSFHDRGSEARLAASYAERLHRLAGGRRLVWVVGNHDAEGPQSAPGEVTDVLVLGALTLRHEPLAGPQPGEVSGHLHPCAKVRASQGAVRRRCFVTDAERAVLPAFGAYAGGLNVRDRAFSGLFTRPPIAGALGRDRVHAVGWRSLTPD
jgi:DNA ligase-associated metallophosphoesterase